jgi:hypothetical protein
VGNREILFIDMACRRCKNGSSKWAKSKEENVRKLRHVFSRVLSLGLLAGASLVLVMGCGGAGGTELIGMVLTYANESLSTMQITAPSFANGAGPWTPPSDCTGTFLEIEADNSTGSAVLLVIRVGSTGTSSDGVYFRFALDAGAKLHTDILCRFNGPQASIKAWHDGSEGVADLTGIFLTVIPTYWLVNQ